MYCGSMHTITDGEQAVKQIEDALKEGLVPELLLKTGEYVILHDIRGKEVVGRVGKRTGPVVRMSAKRLEGAVLDTHTQAIEAELKKVGPRWETEALEFEKQLTEDLSMYDKELDDRVMQQIEDSKMDPVDKFVGQGSMMSKVGAFLTSFRPARYALSTMYNTKGENLQAKHGVEIDGRLHQMQEMNRRITMMVEQHALGHMSGKEMGQAKHMLTWLLDGSSMAEIKREFGRAPTEKEVKAAFMLRSAFGTAKGKGLHGLFEMEGFLTHYLPHVKRARELQGELIEKGLKGEELSEQEQREWRKLVDKGAIPAELAVPENLHKLNRAGTLENWETDFFKVFQRYVDTGLKVKYFEPLIREVEKEYGLQFQKHLGKWETGKKWSEQEMQVVSVQKRSGIGKFEKEYLLRHLTSILGYPTEAELGLSRSMQKVMVKAQELFPESALLNRLPAGEASFNTTARALQSAMYAGGLGGRVSSALKQTTGFPLTVAFLGPKWSAAGVGIAARDMVGSLRRAREAGVLKEYLPAKDKEAKLGKKTWRKIDHAAMYLFEIGDGAQRVVAFEGGRAKALARKGKLNVRHVRDIAQRNRLEKYKAQINDRSLTAKERADALEKLATEFGRSASEETQFKYGKGHSPMHFRSDLGRFAGMFMTWPMYFMGALGHWSLGSYGRAAGVHGLTKRAAIWGTAEMFGRVGPLILGLWAMQRIAEQTDSDMSHWITEMFEVPIDGAPMLRMGVDAVRLGNAGAQRLVSEMGSEAHQKLRSRDLHSAFGDFINSWKIVVPFSGMTSDILKARRTYDEEGLRRLFGIRGLNE